MKWFSKITERLHVNRIQKDSEKHTHSHRTEYLLNEKSAFNVTEAFRNLKATLSVSIPKKEGGVAIMATSAYPEDGKTTVTANLALMFALSDAKVVLVDADIRKGRIARYFKQKTATGLSDYLSGQCALDEVIRPSQVNENLSFISCGTRSPKPYELLESEEMKKLLEELRRRYDYVIIDTPPVLLISDALAITKMTDGAMLICRHEASYVNDISRALNALSFAKANILGVVVNDYKAQIKNKRYGNYGRSRYYSYYSYSDTPSEQNEEKTE